MEGNQKPFKRESLIERLDIDFALKAARLGIWELDPNTKLISWDERCRELFGLAKDNLLPYEQAVSYIHEDDVTMVREAVNRAMNPNSNGEYDITYRTIGADDGVLRWVRFIGHSYLDSEGEVYRFAGIAQDVSDDVKMRNQLQNLVANTPDIITRWDKEGKLIYANIPFAELTENENNVVLASNRYQYNYKEDTVYPSKDQLLAVFETGKPQKQVNAVNTTDGEVLFHSRLVPEFGPDGTIESVLAIALDITKLKESEIRYQTMIEQSPMAIGLLTGRDMVIEVGNNKIFEVWGRNRSVIGMRLVDVLPEIKDQGFIELLENVYDTGEPYFGSAIRVNLVYEDGLHEIYFDFVYTPMHNTIGIVTGIMIMAVDVTETVKARLKLEESEQFSKTVFNDSPIAKLVVVGKEMIIRAVNVSMTEMLGRGKSIIGMQFLEAVPEFETTLLMGRLENVFKTGETYHNPEEKFDLIRFGKPYTGYYNYIQKALINAAGERYGVIITATEVTQQVLARQKVEEAKESLRGAIELAELAIWSVDIRTGAITYDARMKEWVGAEANGQEFNIATNHIPEEDRERIRRALHVATQPGSNGIYDEIHLIENVLTSRRRIIHAQAKTYFDANGKPYKLMGTAQDITEQHNIQLALEHEVIYRTEELATTNEELATINEEYLTTNEELAEANQLLMKSNENLQKFAYVASHDLQEPLRKIQSFGDILKNRYAAELGPGLNYLERMQSAAKRMSTLIQDLLAFSQISIQQDNVTPVSLTWVTKTVLADLELSIQETEAAIIVDTLPMVKGEESQLCQLFQNLISNALKFRKANVAPIIQIDWQIIRASNLPLSVKPVRATTAYDRINVTDNGIGFNQIHADRIFQVFQRLHGKNEYPGTGVGLAICEKVVLNHGGAISVSSEPGVGTTFSIYLPIG